MFFGWYSDHIKWWYISCNAKKKTKPFWFKPLIFLFFSSTRCILLPVPHKAVIFDPLMQRHEMSYFLKLTAFMYSSYLYCISLFFLITRKAHWNPLSQSWLFFVRMSIRPFLEYCLRMIGLKVTFDMVSRSDCTLCHNNFLKHAMYFAHRLPGPLCSRGWLASKKKKRKIKNQKGKRAKLNARNRENTQMPGERKGKYKKSELGNYLVEFRLNLVIRLKTKWPPVVRVHIKCLCIFKCIVLISCPFSYYAECLLLHFLWLINYLKLQYFCMTKAKQQE